MAKQYCRYCVYLCVNNEPYCTAKNEFKSVKSCKQPNKCKEFVFCEAEPEYQDAFGETNGYVPRERKVKACTYDEFEQLSLFGGEE